jgi:hypothetical protein
MHAVDERIVEVELRGEALRAAVRARRMHRVVAGHAVDRTPIARCHRAKRHADRLH